MVAANQSLGEYGNLEAFYQFKWEPTPIEAGCGNYWAVAQGNIAASPGACSNATAVGTSTPNGFATGNYVTTVDGKEAKDQGQFGLAYRFNAEALDTEFGLYAMNIHARTPVFSLKYKDGNFAGTNFPLATYWEYPEDMQVYGVSAATNIKGWSVTGELSQTKNFRAQLDGNDMFNGSFGAGPLAGVAAPDVASHGSLHGGVKTNKNQFQISALQAGNGILSAAQWLAVAEVGYQWNSLDLDGVARFNRPFIFGSGPDASYGGNTCATNVSTDGCSKNKGYVTQSSWGYRLLGQLTYNNVFGSSITAYPRVFWSQDVRGYAVDGAFVEDRTTLGLGVKFSYAKQYTLDLGYTRYGNGAEFDPLRDRDHFTATLAVTF